MKKRIFPIILMAMLLVLTSLFFPAVKVNAEDAATAVSVGEIDYEQFTMELKYNGNSFILMSTDGKKTWNEVEGEISGAGNEKAITIDISWASPSSNVKLYFKGNSNKTETEIVLPKQDTSFKVKFDKITSDFTMTNGTGATSFYWRKSTDSQWKEVPFETSSEEYKAFLKEVESLRFKGAKLVFRTGQVKGNGAENVGNRPSKEINVSITKYSAAPKIKPNVTKLTLNTKDTMEYTLDLAGDKWTSCEKNMDLTQVAAGAFIGNAGDATPVTVYFRVAQTEKKAASLICSLTIPAQTKGPDVSANGTDVKCTENTDKQKYEFSFLTASATNALEYCIITPSGTFDLTKAKWRPVKKSKTISVSKKSAPDGTVVYFRFKGVAENVAKGIELQLPSEYKTFTVKWSEKE